VPPDVIPLEFLNCGEWADVAEVMGDPALVGRMAELGVHKGSRVRLLQPGSPCILQIGDARFSLRADWAMQIFVQRVAG
jgi:Fe2+ transport system protein FeoA